MSEDYLQTSRMLNLAHTLTLQDKLTPGGDLLRTL